MALAAERGIPAQDGVFASYGSDGLAIAETGSPTALVTVGDALHAHGVRDDPRGRPGGVRRSCCSALVTSPLPPR